ncbi:hypothetical protein HAX54_005223, partial [Datura stramonium]|nr:hypothetical protein [Datura stramonium]
MKSTHRFTAREEAFGVPSSQEKQPPLHFDSTTVSLLFSLEERAQAPPTLFGKELEWRGWSLRKNESLVVTTT